MKLFLDEKNRKFIQIEIELDGQNIKLVYFEKNTKQFKALKKRARKDGAKMHEVDDLSEEQFFINLKGEQKDIDALVEFYEENGNFYDFINMCDVELGKLKSKV